MNILSTFLLIISCFSVVYTQNLSKYVRGGQVDASEIGDICKIKNSERQGICKPIGECPYVLTIIMEGGNYLNCGYEKRVILVCCRDDFQTTPVTSRQIKRISEIKCSEYKSAVYEQIHPTLLVGSSHQPVLASRCALDHKWTGGKNANPKEFPHMALIGIYYGSNQHSDWFCGGSLISDQFVLTAAHCFIKNPNIVRLGELDYSRSDEEASPQDYTIMNATLHPYYLYPSKHHDIALIELNRKVEFNTYRRPACLSSFSTITEKSAIASGWGQTEAFNDSSKSSMLLKVVLNLFNQSECIDIYSRQEIPIIGNQFCAGSKTEAIDTCQGDSGGPLQVIHESYYCMYDIIGITSFGTACAVLEPAVYTKVYPYLSWIEQIVWNTSSDRIIFKDA